MTSPLPVVTAMRRAWRRYRYGRIRLGHSLLRHALELFTAKCQLVELRCGVRMYLDLSRDNQNTIFWLDGDLEPQLTWAIRALLPVSGVFVDCGANAGLMGLLARQYRGARVVFLEPHPRLAETVRENIRLNGFDADCTLVEAAASSAEGEATFYEHDHANGSHSLHQAWSNNESRALGRVRVTTLAAVIKDLKLPSIDFLKVDTEGNDLAVLQGLGNRLTPEFCRVLYVEMSVDRDRIAALLEKRGYTGFGLVRLSRYADIRRLRAFEAGSSVTYFAPCAGTLSAEGEVLWCGSHSDTSEFLRRVARKPAENA